MYCPDFAIFGFKYPAEETESKHAPQVAAPAPRAPEVQDAR
jgi:hypothetical protein